MKMKKVLIDKMANDLNFLYLSDIRQAENLPLVYQYLAKINKDAYSKEEWEELYYYLSGSNKKGLKDVNIYDELLTYLTNHKK